MKISQDSTVTKRKVRVTITKTRIVTTDRESPTEPDREALHGLLPTPRLTPGTTSADTDSDIQMDFVNPASPLTENTSAGD